MCKVSIIIPVYNGENKIKNNLEALCEQKFKDWEAIIVDDGSTDNTKKVIQQYQSKNQKIKYFYKKNSGVSDTRNFGIKKSKGKYICFIDCDDFYEKIYLEELYNKIVIDNADLCYCGYKTFNSLKNKKVYTRFIGKEVLYHYFMGNIKLQTGCFLIKKELIENHNIRFRSGVNWGEDYEFFSKVIKHSNKTSYVRKYLLNYDNQENVSKLSTISLDKIEKDKKMVENIHNELNLSRKEQDALIYYREPALILNKLYMLQNVLDKTEIKKIYLDNYQIINRLKIINIIKYIKLKYIKFRLKRIVK